jgi:hypothetical protein
MILALGFWRSLAPTLAAQPAEWRLGRRPTSSGTACRTMRSCRVAPKDGIASIDHPAFAPAATNR